MKNSNKAKRFWTLNRHHAGGFTLVELIVVIAILAILAGVAVPAYSGYVTQANKQADVTLTKDVAHALELAFYNRELTKGMVVLTKDGVKTTDGALSEESQAALEAAFGSVESIPGLKYNGWNGEYDGGSFQGKEKGLLMQVEGLTTSLADFLKNNKDKNVLGGRFGTYMKNELGFSDEDMANNDKVADAAVLYVANTTENLSPEKQEKLANIGDCENISEVMYTLVNDVYDGNLFVGTAAAYAMMTGYCHANNISIGGVDASMVGDNPGIAEMTAMLGVTFGNAIGDDMEVFEANWAKYAKEQGNKDASAFIEVMGTVNGAKGLVTENLGKEDCFDNAELEKVIQYFSEGNIVVLAETRKGQLEVTVVPAV